MARGKNRSPVDTADAPEGADTVLGVEKEPYMASDDKRVGDGPTAAAVAPEDVVISALIHCDGCARKLRRWLQRLDGGVEVVVDNRTNMVVLSGPRAVQNAVEAVKIVDRKTGSKATLLSPSPEKLPFTSVKGARMKKKYAGGDMGDEIAEVDTDMAIVLRINLHCDACCEEIKRRILKVEGVKEAAPLLKSSQMMVKGMVEPATLVGFIHRSTGRKAAIIRAEPMNLLPTIKSPPTDAQLIVAETMHEDPSVHSGDKKGGHAKEMKEVPHNQENRGEVDSHADDKLPTENKQSDGRGIDGHDGEASTNGGDGFVLENYKKGDHLFRASPRDGVVTVAPDMAFNNLNPYYTYPPYPYAHMQHYNHCPQPYAYAYSPAALYGYPHAPEALSEENSNSCTIV